MTLHLTPGQQRFISIVSNKTGLDARVVTAWVYAEENGGAARAREAQGNHNWLNIGPGHVYRTPEQGADAVVRLLKTSGYYSGIRKAARSGDVNSQITAIVQSPWDAGHYQGGAVLHQLVGQAPHARTSPVYGLASTHTHTTPAHENVDSAILDSLLTPHRPGTLLKSVVGRLNSGAYTTPARTTTTLSAPKMGARVIPGGVTVDPNANRAGVNINPGLIKWLGSWAGSVGGLHIGTGTNHNQFVAGRPGVQSDHWTGNAVDIPATGRRGDEIAYNALRRLGVSDKQARLFIHNGGIYNVVRGGHRYQVIWKTNEGGDHFNHVHIGRR